MNKNLYSLGLMSGTSMDGIDVSIIKSDGEQVLEVVDDIYLKYDDKIRSKLKKIINKCLSKNHFLKLSKEINKLEEDITLLHFKACELIRKRKHYKTIQKCPRSPPYRTTIKTIVHIVHWHIHTILYIYL